MEIALHVPGLMPHFPRPLRTKLRNVVDVRGGGHPAADPPSSGAIGYSRRLVGPALLRPIESSVRRQITYQTVN